MWAHRMNSTAALDYVRRGQSSHRIRLASNAHTRHFHSPRASLAQSGLSRAARPFRTLSIRALAILRHLYQLAIQNRASTQGTTFRNELTTQRHFHAPSRSLCIVFFLFSFLAFSKTLFNPRVSNFFSADLLTRLIIHDHF
jgi:hypothetical protein